MTSVIGDAEELTNNSPLPPSNLAVLKHIAFKRRQIRKSRVCPNSLVLLTVAEELMVLCHRHSITPYPRLFIFFKLEQLDKKLHAISKLPKTSQAPAMVRFMLELCQPFTLARRERACVVLRHKSWTLRHKSWALWHKSWAFRHKSWAFRHCGMIYLIRYSAPLLTMKTISSNKSWYSAVLLTRRISNMRRY